VGVKRKKERTIITSSKKDVQKGDLSQTRKGGRERRWGGVVQGLFS